MLPTADLKGHQPLRIEGELRNVVIHVCDCTSILLFFLAVPSLEPAVQQDCTNRGKQPGLTNSDELLTGGGSPIFPGTRTMLFPPAVNTSNALPQS